MDHSSHLMGFNSSTQSSRILMRKSSSSNSRISSRGGGQGGRGGGGGGGIRSERAGISIQLTGSVPPVSDVLMLLRSIEL